MPHHEQRASWWGDVAHDIRHGVRLLRRSPMFTVVAILTLTLGIGANIAIFSLIDVLVLRDLPVRDPASLVQFLWQYPGDPPLSFFSVPDYERFRDRNSVFSDIIGTAPVSIAVQVDGAASETVRAEFVTGNFFPVLGVRPAAGRLLSAEDQKPGAAPAAVVSWSYWRSRFNRSPGVLSSRIILQNLPVVQNLAVPVPVVGVAERSFSGLVVGYEPDVWISAATLGTRLPGFVMMARLKDGITIDRARAEMRVLDRPRIEEFARKDPQWLKVTLEVDSARSGLWTPLHGQFTKPLLGLLAIVGMLLLLACSNIGSMLLARGANRQREIAVRMSLGAGRFRIVRQMLAESLVLAATGGLIGIVAASLSGGLLARILTAGTRMIGPPPRLDVTVDANVLMFTTGVTMLAGILFTVAPTLAAMRSSPMSVLHERGGTGQTTSRRLFSNGLVVAQVALSLVLVSVSQLYLGHLANLRNRSLGFNRNSVLLISVDTARGSRSHDQVISLYPEVLDQLGGIAGVRSVTVSGMIPLSGAAGSRFVTVEGFQEEPQARRRLLLNGVAPNYFATFGTPLIAGRDFTSADVRPARVAIVNQAMARYYFHGGSPLGKHVWFDNETEPYEIVGLVGDAKYADIRSAAPPTIYLHYSTLSRPPSQFSLRTSVPPLTVSSEVRQVLEDPARSLPVTSVTTLAEHVDAVIVPERLIAGLSAFFGAVGISLAAMGLYGLLAFMVAQRTREIGVRMALGATVGHVTSLVLKRALGLVCAGLIIGLPIAFWSERMAAAMVENLAADSLFPIAVAGVGAIAVSLLAAWMPARRASRVDPVVALRAE